MVSKKKCSNQYIINIYYVNVKIMFLNVSRIIFFYWIEVASTLCNKYYILVLLVWTTCLDTSSSDFFCVCMYVCFWVVLRKGVPMCDIELVALDLHVLVADRLVQCATYTV